MNYIQAFIDFITHSIQLHPDSAQWIIFLIAFVESVAILGSLFPGTLLLTPVGVMLGSGALPFAHTLYVIFLGAFLGDVLGFLIGKLYHHQVEHLSWIQKHKKTYLWFQDFLEKHGAFSLVIGRFVGPLRSSVPLFAGLLNMSWFRFILGILPSIVLWGIAYLSPGFLVGRPQVQIYFDTHVWPILNEHLIASAIYSLMLLLSFFMGSSPIKRSLARSLRAFSIFGLVATFMNTDFMQSLDTYISQYIHPLPPYAAYTLSTYGEAPLVLPACLLVIAYAYRTPNALYTSLKKRSHVALLFLLIALSLSIPSIKAFFARPRPELAESSQLLAAQLHAFNRFSFPSGHAATCAALVCFGSYLIPTSWKQAHRWLAYLLGCTYAVLVAFARLSTREHWFSDVCAGVSLGIALASMAWVLHLYLQSHEQFSKAQRRFILAVLCLLPCYQLVRCCYV